MTDYLVTILNKEESIMKISRLYITILALAFLSLPVRASSYNSSTSLDLEFVMADELSISIDNGGVIIFTNLAEDDVIDTSADYNIASDPDRGFSCHITYNSTNYNIGDVITAPLKSSDNNPTGINFNLTFVSCNTGVNNMTINGTISMPLDSGATYHVDTQFISVTYDMGTIMIYS